METGASFRVGDVLERKYRLERLIGAGGMGVVFAATHLELQHQVAVKLLRPEHCEREASVARFVLEARVIARLNGPHVARVLDVGRLGSGVPFMVMELLEGRSLHELIRQQGVPSHAQAVDWLLQACEAVAEAHRAGVLHRDLKPANLFLARDAYGEACIKVLDFGISKVLGAGGTDAVGLTESHGMVGSPAYMSPEQMRSARDVDQRTDIWGLGTVLFELLTGRTVWTGQSFGELCAQVTRDLAPKVSEYRPDVPVDLGAVVERCLQRDPFARYQRVSDLALALARFATQNGRETSRRVLQLAAAGPASRVPGEPGDSAASDSRMHSTAHALPATAVTRLGAGRARVLPVLVLCCALIILVGLSVVRWGRVGLARSRPVEHSYSAAHRIIAVDSGNAAVAAEAGAIRTEPVVAEAGAIRTEPVVASEVVAGELPRRPTSKVRLAPLVSSANSGSSGAGRIRPNTAVGTVQSAGPVPTVDPMSIREATPNSPSDPMSIRR